jgi:hypothetical protein
MEQLRSAAFDHPLEELGGMPGVSQALAPVLARIAASLGCATEGERTAENADRALRRLGSLYAESPGAKCECFVALCQVVASLESTPRTAADARIAELAAQLWLAACVDVPSEVLLLLSPARGRDLARRAIECSASRWVRGCSGAQWREAWHTCALGRFALAGSDGAFKPSESTCSTTALSPTTLELAATAAATRAVFAASFVPGVGIRTSLREIAAAVSLAPSAVDRAVVPARAAAAGTSTRKRDQPLPPSPPAHGGPPPTRRSSTTAHEAPATAPPTPHDGEAVDEETLTVAAVAVAGATRHGPGALHDTARQVAWCAGAQSEAQM